SDHVSGLAIFLKYHPVPVYGSAATLDYLACRGLVPPGAELIDIDGRTQDVCGFAVQSFETSHDSVACRGYRITTPLGRVGGVATDLGYARATRCWRTSCWRMWWRWKPIMIIIC
ncbi:MAG: hypothetical protein V8T36_02285, partial [Ruthenibacterium lactatiformans]